MGKISERHIIEIAAIAKAAELDGIECSIRSVATGLGLKKSAHVNDLVKQAADVGLVRLITVTGGNGLDMFLIVPTEHYIYPTLEALIQKHRIVRL